MHQHGSSATCVWHFSCFQNIVVSILVGIPGLTIYLDDIVVHGNTLVVHDACLHRVMEALAKHHLMLNGEKCVFVAPAIEYVGFHLSYPHST